MVFPGFLLVPKPEDEDRERNRKLGENNLGLPGNYV